MSFRTDRFAAWLRAMGLVALASGCTRSAPAPDDDLAMPAPDPGVASSGSTAQAPPRGLLEPIEELKAEAGIADDEDPLTRGGDLRRDLERFRSMDDCVAAHAPADPLIEDALEALGYTTLAHDACRLLDALKSRDPGRCASISASSLRERCQAWVAAYAGDPELCPRSVELGSAKGRDPVCLARARRDERLCEAALGFERARCRALVRGDPAACGRDLACAREVERWSGLVAPADAGTGAGLPARMRVEVHGIEGTVDPKTTVFEMPDEAAAGGLVRQGKNAIEVTVGAPRNAAWSSPESPYAIAHAFLQLRLPADAGADASVPVVPLEIGFAPGIGRDDGARAGRDGARAGSDGARVGRDGARDRAGRGTAGSRTGGGGVPRQSPDQGARAQFELLLPQVADIASANGAIEGEVRVARLGAAPGSPIELSAHLTVREPTRSFDLRWEIATYVREIVPAKPGK